MGETKSNQDKKKHLDKLKLFSEYYLGLSNPCKLEYLATILPRHLKYIEELITNFLQSKIKIEYKTLKLLEYHKNYLYKLSEKNNNILIKQKLLNSVKGVYILNLLLPPALITLNQLISK